jgi:hypothetical protein
MIAKRLIRPQRLRQVPPSFSWIDHRLVRLNLFSQRSHPALVLYFFLLAVADAQGLSYYSDKALCRHLGLGLEDLARARRELLGADWIAFEKPLYQVLSLDQEPQSVAARQDRPGDEQRSNEPRSAGDILRRILQPQGGSL